MRHPRRPAPPGNPKALSWPCRGAEALELVGAVAKIKKRADMYISTLRRFVEAMGGELEIVARFADHTVKTRNFADLNEKKRG
jgi:hypothetical protein